MSEPAPLVWVVIPSWNRRDDLLSCVESVTGLDYPNFRTLVVDNASEDGSAAAVRELYPDVTVLEMPRNLGAAAASNAGFERALAAGAAYVLRLDSDTVLAPDFLAILVSEAESASDVGAVMGKIRHDGAGHPIWSMGARHTSWLYTTQDLGRGRATVDLPREPVDIDYIWATGLLLNRRALEISGGFDPDFHVYYEEMDLSCRLRAAGLRLRLAPAAVMWHKPGQEQQNARVAYNWARGKMLFFRKHSRGVHRLALIAYAYAYALYRALRRRADVGNRGPLRAALAGLTAGLRHPL